MRFFLSFKARLPSHILLPENFLTPQLRFSYLGFVRKLRHEKTNPPPHCHKFSIEIVF